ncbi:hypothetical protein Pcinc_003437 [Petrolisthes cinctipes]|uniref:Cubilin n=1 Tax=Petrolisthes cinctipes TaxID=88211 RepID=A0AAE1L2I5_PETCI|nr:hypothetical protein Pcinc_003437 [Petrolisthes cinctipes]
MTVTLSLFNKPIHPLFFPKVSAVRPQLQSLNQSQLGFLLTNLSQVARTVASTTWISTSISAINVSVTRNTGNVASLQGDVATMRTRLDPLVANVSRISSQLSLVTPDAAQRLQHLNQLITTLQQSTSQNQETIRTLRDVTVAQLRQDVVALQAGLAAIPDLRNRLNNLENTTMRATINGTTSISLFSITMLQREVSEMKSNLLLDECVSGPCQNAGTCIDGYLKYTCLCRKGWRGQNCAIDFNECYEYQGTDLGCQNGGRCVNTPGSYRCECTAGWYGANCAQKSDNCSGSNGAALCGGHGACVPTSRPPHHYSCLCDQGWKPGTSSPACVDVDECTSSTPHCSRNPPVLCVNYPGGFSCGPCPQGYSGDGFVCTDVDECQFNNGGCSPFSVCYNTLGGRRCGPCAPGYSGNGMFCTPSSRPCLAAPCHPLAQCYDNPQMSSTYFQCTCPPGYIGNGIGPQGCMASGGGGGGGGGGTAVVPTNPCANHPCRNGATCTQTGYTFTCTCPLGYTGYTCEVDIDECASNPCLNGGTCTQGLGTYTCNCPSSHTGDRCQTENEQCGGRLVGTEGEVSFPGQASPGQQYGHNISCAWVITVPRAKVINVTFGYFHLEGGSCRWDWLQIHDGPSSRSHLHGRYCGSTLPGTNGTIISTHNHLYLWFRSDHSRAYTGFNFTWNATDPVCGADLQGAEYGSIKSPGYPGRYPLNRDCYWTVQVTPGKRIKFHFPTLQMEHHDNCSYDFLEVRDGLTETSHSLGKFCSTTTPAPLTTSGSEALLHFHSDYSSTDTGFLISYSAEPGIPGCGGLLTGERGEFSAPTFSDRYQHNLHCPWVIRVHPQERVNLNFTEFHLEQSRTCYWDYVEVRDGGEADSPLITKACGLNLPEPITSSGNQLYVLFHSDYSVAHAGFTATYQVDCGGEYSGDTGLIHSPYSPDHYPSNRECVYIIRQPVGKAILLNFTFFDIEHPSYWSGRCVFDYVEIRDGRRSTSPQLGRFCGPESHRPDPVLSTHNFMYIKFVTDSSVQNHGFIANYTTIDITCGAILTAVTGVINSPNSPDTYPANSYCRWVLDLPPGYVIQLTWHSFSLEDHHNCNYDWVEVFDNSTFPGRRMGERLCGNTLPPIMTSSDNLVTVQFHSDTSVNTAGFSLFYHGLDASRACGGHYHTETGIITSPNYPENYPHSRICEWTISAPRRQQIRLTFDEMLLEESDGCNYDFLEIRNGKNPTSPLLTTICSFNQSVPEVLSHTHQLYIKFQSDYSVQKKGFKLLWDSLTTGCGGVLTGVTGEIISPGYPQGYYHRTDCYWTIRVAQGSSVALYFTDLDLETSPECVFDFAELRDGSDSSSPLLGRYCTMSQGFVSVNSTSNTLWIRFRSDWSGSGRGFKAQYHTNCNRVVRGHRGVITTPNFPNPYPHDRNCTWIIEAPRGNSINASFSEFVLEDWMDSENNRCLYDYVELREAETRDGTRSLLRHLCRTTTPPPVYTSQRKNILEVQFVSDFMVAENGFRMEWIVNGCGGLLTKASGGFSSPGYPQAYPHDTECEWYISTSPGSRIRITIHEFDIEHAAACVFDTLHVFGGEDDLAPQLLTLCHQQTQPTVVTTQGNHAFVRFASDQSVKGKGFNISYSTLPGGCGGLYTSSHGSIHSPNYPDQYNSNADCVWTITVNPLHVVELNFTHFDVEHEANCTYDNITVYDGADTSGPVLLHHCGTTLPETAFVRSTSNSITVRLITDENIRGRGFYATYATGCGARLEVGVEGAGELTSPHYPSPSPGSINCSWHLHAPQGYRVYLHVVHMNIESRFPINDNCTLDYLAILEGDLWDSPEVGRYCGSSSPRPLVSEAEYLTVNLVSHFGYFVSFRAVYSVLTSACGGDLTSASGELATPHYPEPYPTNIECVWTISAGPGNRLQLNFIEFDIEASDGCNLDYLEVHEMDAAGPLLLHNCSSSSSFIPTSITAKDTLWIKFRSDGTSAAAKGFLASYSLLYGDRLYGTSGEIVSPLYPHAYMGREDVVWKIRVPWRKAISFTFLDLDVEGDPVDDSCFASLVFYNGWSERWSPVLGTYCGHQIPDEPLVSSRRRVMVVLHANHLHQGSKFRLRYEAVDYRDSPGIRRQASANNCSFIVNLNSNGTSTYITHPNYPDPARHNVDCQIDVFDGVEGTMNWNRTARLCRRNQVSLGSMVSSGRFLKLHFVTDSSVSSRGFRGILTAVCGGYLRGPEGVIMSTGYPEDYPMAQNCEWTVRVAIGRTIRLEFDELKIANSTPACGGDYLLIQNGGMVSSPFLGLGKFCGRSIPGNLESSSNLLKLSFVSDAMDHDKGFKLRYYEQADTCGGAHRLTSDLKEVTFSSPNFPNSPDPHTECSWTISAPPEKSISITFQGHFEVPNVLGSCDQAFVEVRDGGTILSPLLRKFCGSTLPDTQHSTGDTIYVRYYNNITIHHAGFQAKAAIDTCGGTYSDWAGGIITSPGYPTPYTSELNCTWRIVAPFGHYVSLHFLQVEIYNADENCTNPQGRLQIRDKNATGELLATICGAQDTVQPINTPSNIAHVTFRGGPNPRSLRGFRILYNMSTEVCGGEIGGPEGFFQSPGYPHGYSSERECQWNIVGPSGRRIKLDIIDLDMPHGVVTFGPRSYPTCSSSITIWDGIVEEAPWVTRICGRNDEENNSINSSMNTMKVIFRTVGHSSARGFRARWTTEDLQACGDLTNSSLVVQFLSLSLDQFCASAIHIDGVKSDGGAVRLRDVCDTTSAPPTIVPYHTLRITYVQHRNMIGSWNLTVRASPCGGMLHGPQDVITSPNYPSNYPNNAHCAWALHYGQGEQIDFHFTSFTLESSANHDFVKVYNGPRPKSPLLGRYSGSNIDMNVGRSMTNNLLVQFSTDDSGTYRGFRAMTASHTRGCGGVFHGKTGNISSHGFPSDYPANSECVWEIDTPAGYHSVLTFTTSFDVETSDNCQNDYLQVLHSERSGDPHGPLQWVGGEKLCGKQLPAPVIASGDRLRLLFHTNEAVQGDGFQMSWESLCGMNYTQPSGYIVSPGHPDKYPNYADCDYRIVTDRSQYIVINFLSFDLEENYGFQCTYDYLTVYEERQGIFTRRRWQGRNWGPYCGGDAPPDTLTTRGTTVLHFHSDLSVTKLGFVANFSIQVCGGNLTAPAIIRLPTQPLYHDSMNCVWDITAPEGKVVHIKFQALVLETHYRCRYDSVSIYDGHTNNDDNLLSRLCGNHTEDLPVVVTPGKNVRIRFRSDDSRTFEGFRAAIEFTYACGGNINISSAGATSQIRSLDTNNDGYYEPLLECHWLVVGHEDQVVTLNFTRLKLEPPGANATEPCPYDRIEIYDGPSRKSPLISTHCNSSSSSSLPSVSASSNIMYIYFTSDSFGNNQGFTATLGNVPHPCGASSFVATNQTQSLESPGYPNHYPLSTRCRWIISAPEEDQDIDLEFNDFHLESSTRCAKDKLYVADFVPSSTSVSPISSGRRYRYYVNIAGHRVRFTYGSSLEHNYCGSVIPHHLTSATSKLELRLVSDADTVASGFRLHYSIATCNRTFNSTSGMVMGRRDWCFTTFRAPEGSFINLYFYNFYIRNTGANCTQGNTLRVYDGADSSSPLLVSACGWRNPGPVHSTGNVLRLEHTPQRYGRFKLTYTTSTVGGGCGGSMYVRRRARLYSPGYPGAAQTNLDCLFSITVPPDTHASIGYTYLDFAGEGGCNNTYLQVYDVNVAGEPILQNTICGTENMARHVAPSNRMVVRYVTGPRNITGQGWTMSIRPAIPHQDTVFDTSEDSSDTSE